MQHQAKARDQARWADATMKSRFRWPLTASVLIIAVAFGIWAAFFRGPSEKCKPVVDILEFNHAQAARVSEQPADPNNPVPTQAEDLIYQQWADGLAERAQKVSDPGLQVQAIQLAQLASGVRRRAARVRAAMQHRAPGRRHHQKYWGCSRSTSASPTSCSSYPRPANPDPLSTICSSGSRSRGRRSRSATSSGTCA